MAVCTIYYIPETGTIRVFFPFRPMHIHPVLPRTIVGGAKRTRYYKHIDCISAGNLEVYDYLLCKANQEKYELQYNDG